MMKAKEIDNAFQERLRIINEYQKNLKLKLKKEKEDLETKVKRAKKQ